MRSIALGLAGAALLTAVAAVPAEAATSTVKLYKVVYDPSGKDTHSNAQIDREYVVLKNTGRHSVKITGWTVRDTKKHVYAFGSFTLKAGAYVYIHTGRGTDTGKNVYQQRGWYVWNNTADKVYLRTTAGSTVDTCGWTRKSPGHVTC